MGIKRMSFEGKIYHGTAGSEATNEFGNVTEITEPFTADEGDTTEKGTSGIPFKTSRVTAIGYELQFTMYQKEGDTALAAIRAAAVSGSPIALRTKSNSTGTGVDADFIIKSRSHAKPMGGSQTYAFTASLNEDLRTPQLDV